MGKIQHHLFVRLREPQAAPQLAYAPSIYDTVNHEKNGDIPALILVFNCLSYPWCQQNQSLDVDETGD